MNSSVLFLFTTLFFISMSAMLGAEESSEAVSVEVNHGPINPYRGSGVPVNVQQVQALALKVRDSQVSQGDLSRSWSKVKVAETRQRIYKHEKEWVVRLTNPAETDRTRNSLYIFIDLDGDVVDVNFTGK